MAAYGRTDLACESPALEGLNRARAEGVEVSKEEIEGLPLLAVKISSRAGAELLGKPQGLYYTLELGRQLTGLAEDFAGSVRAVAGIIQRCCPKKNPTSVLIAALGNPDITPDAIGPITASHILVTAHLKERHIAGFDAFASTVLCRTGVLGTTGIESAAQIRSLCREVKPELVIAVDALAGSEVGRLCRSVQICDSGISPGSGVGNDRQELNGDTLGVPVLAIGVPTVIDASSLCEREGIERMFVTPRDIDAQVRTAGKILGYGINMALHPGLEIEDMEMLLG